MAQGWDCPKGCTLPGGYPQKMNEIGAGHYVCPQSDCQHEIKEKDPQFLCACAKCSNSNAKAILLSSFLPAQTSHKAIGKVTFSDRRDCVVPAVDAQIGDRNVGVHGECGPRKIDVPKVNDFRVRGTH